MRTLAALVSAMPLLCLTVAAAQDGQRPPDIKLLTAAECALIMKTNENEYFIKGPVTIGNTEYESSVISRGGVSFGGIDHFEVVRRSCFVGNRPL